MDRKKKVCKGTGKFTGKGCGHLRFIFAHGLCQICYQRANYKPFQQKKPLKRNSAPLKFRPTIQDEKELKQKDTFLLAYNYWEGKFFIGRGSVELEELQAWNCIHVLDKKNYPLFKYYYKNVVLGSKEQHDLIDQGTQEALKARLMRCKYEIREMWDRYWEYRKQMLAEYREWSKNNHGVYKLG